MAGQTWHFDHLLKTSDLQNRRLRFAYLNLLHEVLELKILLFLVIQTESSF